MLNVFIHFLKYRKIYNEHFWIIFSVSPYTAVYCCILPYIDETLDFQKVGFCIQKPWRKWSMDETFLDDMKGTPQPACFLSISLSVGIRVTNLCVKYRFIVFKMTRQFTQTQHTKNARGPRNEEEKSPNLIIWPIGGILDMLSLIFWPPLIFKK